MGNQHLVGTEIPIGLGSPIRNVLGICYLQIDIGSVLYAGGSVDHHHGLRIGGNTVRLKAGLGNQAFFNGSFNIRLHPHRDFAVVLQLGIDTLGQILVITLSGKEGEQQLSPGDISLRMKQLRTAVAFPCHYPGLR